MDLDMLYEDYGGDAVSPEDEDFYAASCDELDTPKYLIVKVSFNIFKFIKVELGGWHENEFWFSIYFENWVISLGK